VGAGPDDTTPAQVSTRRHHGDPRGADLARALDSGVQSAASSCAARSRDRAAS